MAVGEWGWFLDDAPTPKERVGVIVAATTDGLIFVALGTGTERRPPWYVVDPNSRLGRKLGLWKPTYFYPGTIRLLPASHQRRKHGFGPPEVFAAIKDLFSEIPKAVEVLSVGDLAVTLRRTSAVPPASKPPEPPPSAPEPDKP